MRFGLNTAPLGHKVLRFHDQCCMSRRISRTTEGGVRVDLPHHLLQPFSFVALGLGWGGEDRKTTIFTFEN